MSDSKHEAELRRLNRALRMLSDSNQSVIRATHEAALLNDVCRIAVDVGGYRMAWVGLAERDEAKTVRPVAHVGPPAPYVTTGPISWAMNPGDGAPVAEAIRTRQARIVHDIAHDGSYAPWRAAALRSGYRAMVALPMLADGQPIGALSIYADDQHAFDEREMEILNELAGDLGYGLNALRIRAERDRATAKVREQARMMDAFFQQAVTSFVLLDREHRFVRVNEAFARFYGLKPEDFPGKPWTFLQAGDETVLVDAAAMIEEVVTTKKPSSRMAAPYVSPVSLRREVTYWDSTLQPILDEAGEVAFLVYTAKESTGLVLAQRALQQVLRHARTTVMHSDVTAPAGWREHGERWIAANMRWTARFDDEAAAQAVMPLELGPGESYYQGWVRAKHADDNLPMGLTAARAFLADASSWAQEFRAIDRFGQTHWFAQVASIVATADGHWHITTINTDITARRDAEETVIAREREFRALAENTPDFIVRWDRELRRVYVNPAFARATGRLADDLLARALGTNYRPTADEGSPSEIEQVGAKIREVFATGQGAELEMPWVTVEGRRHYSIRFVPEFDRHGALQTVLGISRDITTLKETEQRVRTLADNSPDFIVRYDRACRAVYVNRTVERVLGVPAAQMLGREFGETSRTLGAGFAPAEIRAVRQMMEQTFTTSTIVEANVPLRMQGREIILNVRIVPEVDDTGHVNSVLTTWRDVTVLKQAEHERQTHLWFLESMDRVNRAIQGAADLEQMMHDVLDVVLEIFECDRAWLVYPCDPSAAHWHVPMERTRPEYPGGMAAGLRVPMDEEVAGIARALLATDAPLTFGPNAERPVPEAARAYQVRSFICVAVHPKTDRPSMFGLHQCSHEREWTAGEQALFREISRRMADALTSLVTVRSLRESEQRLEEAQHIAHVGHWDCDLASGELRWSDETFRIFGLKPRVQPLDCAELEELIHADDREAAMQSLRGTGTQADDYQAEYRIVRPSGEVRNVHARGHVVHDDAGTRVRVFGTIQDVTEDKRTQEALRESQARLEIANRATRIGPWDWNLLTNAVHFSAEWKRQLGYAEDEVASRYEEWESRLHPEDRERVLAQLRAYLAGAQGDYEVEFRLRHRDGSYRWIFTRGELVRDAAGTAVRLIGCHVDITARKQAEEELRKSEDAYVSLVNTVDGIVWELEVATFRFTFVSEQAERLLGYPAAAWLNEPTFWQDHLHPDDREAALSFCVRATKAKRDHDFYYRMIAADGRTVWLHDIVTVVVADDRPVKLRGIMVDVTEAKAAEEALRWRTALFEAQMDSGIDAILVVDSRGRKILQNRRLVELWKIPPHIADDPDDRPQVAFVMSQTKNPQRFMEKVAHLYGLPDEVSRDEIELADGRVFDRYSAPVRDQNGKYYGRIWSFRDITATKQLEEQLRQTQKIEAVGRLAGGIAHDFNNLLTVIQMQASLLLSEPEAVASVGHSINQIMGAAQRAAILTRQLLTFSRRQTKEAHPLDLGDVIGTMTKLVRRILGEDISVETRFAPSLPAVHADPGMMEQVLMNLLVNARDAMPAGGQLVLSLDVVALDARYVSAHPAARMGRFVCLTVSDTGVGISPENLSRIFDPFFTTKEVGKGTGLGLAMVFGIVQEHQGWIDVESEVGRGATFRVFLPAMAEKPIRAAIPAADSVAAGGTETILLVEDDAVVRNVAARALERHGYRVMEATSAVDALERWSAQLDRFDLLVTDLIMPGGASGQQLADVLRQRRPSLRVLFTSGYHDEAITRRLKLEPGRNFLPKPYPVRELLEIVRRRLDQGE